MNEAQVPIGSSVRERLGRCFSVTFPRLSADEVLIASTASVGAWDSLGMLTLIALVEEEFNIVIELDDIPTLISFGLMEDYIESQIGGRS